MTERPILFSGPLVRALLAGTKTQTRRPIKTKPPATSVARQSDAAGLSWWSEPAGWIRCPYGVPGDRLWVKETWGIDPNDLGYPEDQWRDFVVYRAEFPAGQKYHWGWTPSIHMPRWASRLTLEITDVRVPRLQDISEEDAQAEGMEPAATPEEVAATEALGAGDGYFSPASYYGGFAHAWRDIYGAESWQSNPWVWAITFRVIR